MTDIDFISPKNAHYVTLNDVRVVPSMTNFSMAPTFPMGGNLTINGSAYSFGKITTLQFHPQLLFTSPGAVTFSMAAAGIPLPEQTVYVPCIICKSDNVTVQIGYISIDSSGAASVFINAAGAPFEIDSMTGGSSIYAMTITYISA